MQSLVGSAHDQGKHNVEFLAAFLLGRLSDCVDLLISNGRIPEAAFFARTYLPSRVSEVSTHLVRLAWHGRALHGSVEMHAAMLEGCRRACDTRAYTAVAL